jgi:CheY-like chemotaxis protein
MDDARMAEPAFRPRILIVEDEFLIRMTLAEALAEHGFDVAEAASGEEALATLRGDPLISLLLTDIQLPGALNGLDLARSAREGRPDLPVIYVTGRPDAMPSPVQAARDVFVPKPYLPSEVATIARRLTGK